MRYDGLVQGEWLIWLAAASGGLVALGHLLWLQRAACNPQLLNAVFERLCAIGNLDRAIKLCRAAGAIVYGAALLEVFTLLQQLQQSGELPAGLEGRLQELFEHGMAAQREALQRGSTINYVSGALVGGGLVMAATAQHSEPLHLWLALTLAAMLFLASLLRGPYILQSSRDAFPKLLPRLREAAAKPPARPPLPQEAAPTQGDELALAIYQGTTLRRTERFSKPIIKIGKLSSSDLHFDESTVSRMHAIIERGADGQWHILDLGSDTGTRCNGEKVNRHALQMGDEIGIGTARIVVGTKESAAPKPADSDSASQLAAVSLESSAPTKTEPSAPVQSQVRDMPCPGCGQCRFLRVPAVHPGAWRPGDDRPLALEDCDARVCQGCGRVEWFLSNLTAGH
jgi:pSer/pThr/pTyr-binding forkhead associated (FHA) protein